MLNDAFKLTVDVIFKINQLELKEQYQIPKQVEEPYPVRGYADNQNMWLYLISLGSNPRLNLQSPQKTPPSQNMVNLPFQTSPMPVHFSGTQYNS